MSLSYHNPEEFKSDVEKVFTDAIAGYPKSSWPANWASLVQKSFLVSLGLGPKEDRKFVNQAYQRMLLSVEENTRTS